MYTKTLTGDAFVFVGDLLRLFHPRGQAVDLGFGGFFVAFQSVGHRGHRADNSQCDRYNCAKSVKNLQKSFRMRKTEKNYLLRDVLL